MRVLIVAVLLVAIGLGGCAGSSGGSSDAGFEDFEEDLSATATTGIIRGVVVDEALAPLANAVVNITGQAIGTVSDDAGRFGFSDLPAGLYFLEIDRAGYEPVQQSVEVVAGLDKPDIIRVMLTKVPGSDPYFTALSWTGLIGCAYRRWNPPSGGYGTTCPAASTIWAEHDNLVDYDLDMVPAHVQSSIQWDNSQMFGGEISYNLRRTDTNTDTVDHDGTSPITLNMGPEQIAVHADNENRGGFDEDTPLRVIVFTAHLQETEPPTGGWGFGLQLDQRFDTYTHVFYNFQPADDWVFLTDGDPMIPRE